MRWYWYIAGILIACIAVAHTPVVQHILETHLLKRALARFVLLDEPGTITELRSARFALLTRLDPLMAFEGSDMGAFTESLSYVGASQDAYETLYREKDRDADATQIATLLYPRAFLESIPALELARAEVIRTPTPSTIAAYDRAFRNTTTHYRTYLEALIDAYAHFTESESRILGFWGGTLTVDSAARALTQLEKDNAALIARHERRMACATGERVWGCESPVQALRTLRPTIQATPRVEIPPDITTNADIVAATITHTEAPLVVLTQSACMAPTLAPVYFTFESIPIQGFSVLAHRNIFLNTLWFYAIAQMPDTLRTERPFLGAAYDAGLSYLYHNPARMYKCPDAGKDDAMVLTTYSIYQSLRAESLFVSSATETPPLIQAVAHKEELLRTASVFTEDALYAYAEAVATALSTLGEQQVAHYIGDMGVLRAESLLVAMKNHSAKTESLLLNTARGNLHNVPVERAFGPSELGSLLRIRGNPYFFLFAYNPSIAPSAPTFFAERKTFTPEHFYSVTYPGTLSSFPVEEIERLIAESRTEFRSNVWEGAF